MQNPMTDPWTRRACDRPLDDRPLGDRRLDDRPLDDRPWDDRSLDDRPLDPAGVCVCGYESGLRGAHSAHAVAKGAPT